MSQLDTFYIQIPVMVRPSNLQVTYKIHTSDARKDQFRTKKKESYPH